MISLKVLHSFATIVCAENYVLVPFFAPMVD